MRLPTTVRPSTPRTLALHALILTALAVSAAPAPAAPAARPRPDLYFNAHDAGPLKLRFERPAFQAKWKRLLANADALVAAPPGRGPVAGNLGRSRNALGVIGTCAFA